MCRIAVLAAAFTLAALAAPPPPPPLAGPDPETRNLLERAEPLPGVAAMRRIDARLREADEKLYAALERNMPEVSFEKTALSHVLDFLNEFAKLNMQVDWTGIEDAGVNRNTLVTQNVRDLPVRRVLELILEDLSAKETLGFAVEDGVVRVATTEKLDRNMTVHCYPVRDLLHAYARQMMREYNLQVDAPTSPAEDLAEATNPIYRERKVTTTQAVRKRDEAFLEVARNTLIDLVQQTVSVDMWRETGGGYGTLRIYNDVLVVYAHRPAHHDVVRLLAEMRAGGAARD